MFTDWVSPVTGRVVRLHWNSRIARLFGGVNNCITVSASHILISRDWITARGLAHEDGHTVQASRRGLLYIPWILWCYATQGYAKSTPEVQADIAMNANASKYQPIGPVPSYVVDK